ncbi:MAG: Mce protein, partial [Mycobacterium sp.]
MAKHADAADRPLSGSSPVEDSSAVEEKHGQTDEHETDESVDDNAETAVRKRPSNVRFAITVGVAVMVTLGCLAGWLGYRTYENRQAQAQRNQLVQAARQGAVNLTTIDYAEIDADIQRILDSSTGSFHDDFQK